MSRAAGIQESLVMIDVCKETKEEVITMLAQLLHDQGFVKESFLEAVLEREKVYPTGLPLDGFGIAIPHTDAKHVNKSTVAVAVLSKPVTFQMMGSPETDVAADIVFVLAVKDPQHQLYLLKNLTDIFQKNDVLQALKDAASPAEVAELVNREINSNQVGG